MKININLLMVLLSVLITACGGESNSNDNDSDDAIVKISVPEEKYTIKAIDGYLEKARVYADINNNGIGDTEEYLGITNESGELTISSTNKQYSLIVVAQAGVTIDSDDGKTVQKSYELKSPKGLEVINPYTHLAVEKNLPIEDIARDLLMNESPSEEDIQNMSHLIQGDYVAVKTSNDDKQKELASVVHSIARYVTDEIAEAQSNGEGYLENDLKLEQAFQVSSQAYAENGSVDHFDISMNSNTGDIVIEPPVYTGVYWGLSLKIVPAAQINYFVITPGGEIYLKFGWGGPLIAFGNMDTATTGNLFWKRSENEPYREELGPLLEGKLTLIEATDPNAQYQYIANIKWDTPYGELPELEFSLLTNVNVESNKTNIPVGIYSDSDATYSVTFEQNQQKMTSLNNCQIFAQEVKDIWSNGIFSINQSKACGTEFTIQQGVMFYNNIDQVIEVALSSGAGSVDMPEWLQLSK